MLRALRPAAACLAAALLLAACDSQAPPPRTNPFDPGFTGNAIATAPADLALAEATSTTATLSWTDRSSFETGVRVERVDRFGAYQPVATLPPDATRYTDTGLTDTEPRTYRVVALAGGTASAPSAALRIRYPADTLSLGALVLDQTQISPDGERLYTRDGGGTRITSLRTGAALGTIPREPTAIIGFLTGGRLAVRETTPQPSTLGIRFFDGPVQQGLATLRFPSPPYPQTSGGCFGIGGGTTVSADGRRVADVCGVDGALVWTLPSETPLRVSLPYSQLRRLALSPDGTRLFVETPGSTDPRLSAFDAGTGALVWEAPNIQRTTFDNGFGLSADGAVMAYIAGGRLRVVDPTSGAVRVEAAAGQYDGVTAASATEILVAGYDEVLRTFVVRARRVADLSLVRTLPAGQFGRLRLVPGGTIAVAQAGGRAVAVRQSFTAVWEAGGR